MRVSKYLWQTLRLVSVVFSAELIFIGSTLATETPTAISPKTEEITQFTSVSQLSDVSATDWAFAAMQSIANRYGCTTSAIAYQGNQSLTRNEFAASLSACLNQINQLIATNSASVVTKEDLAILQRLQAEFASELTSLQGKVDTLEVQNAKLAAQQFSPTTKLEGEVIFTVSAAGGAAEKIDSDGEEQGNNLVLSSRARLEFNSSFTGEDNLQVRLQARNIPSFADATGTDMARLALEGDGDNELELSTLEYRFPIGRDATIYIEADGGSLTDFTSDLNPLLGDVQDSGTGSISRFGQTNPVLRQSGSTGVGLFYEISDRFRLTVGYVADDADDPESGIFGSAYGAIAQLVYIPVEEIGISLSYVRSYNTLDTGTGSDRANDPFDDESDSISANSYGVEVSAQISPKFIFSGWVGYTQATALDFTDEPQANIVNYALTFAFPDLGKEGNLGGIVIGQPPKLISNDYEVEGEKYTDEDTAWHLEAFYIFQANDNIAITPGVLVIVNPEHDNSNQTVYVGTLRTTFSF